MARKNPLVNTILSRSVIRRYKKYITRNIKSLQVPTHSCRIQTGINLLNHIYSSVIFDKYSTGLKLLLIDS